MEEPPVVMEPPPASSPGPSMSLAARLTNVFAAPGDVFEDVRSARPSMANWLIPALLIIIVGWIGAAVMLAQPTIQHQLSEIGEKAIQKQIEKSHLSKEQEERMREAASKFGSLGPKIGLFAGPVFSGFLTPLWWGFLVWFVGNKVFKAQFGFLKALEVAGLANMIDVLQTLIKPLLVIVTGNFFASPSLALLVSDFDPQNKTHTLMALANVMTFWFLAVVGFGLARLGSVSYGRAIAWVIGIWVTYTGLLVGIGFGVQAAVTK